jgi:hypothetical protein
MKASSLTAYRVKILTNTPLLPVLASLAVNLPATFLEVYRFSYDAYTHIFLADHYRRDWFSLWDGRWFGGFNVASYPPLTHQLIASISFLTGLQTAFQIVSILSATGLTYAVYLYSRIFLQKSEAVYSAVSAALLPSVATTLYGFGQLPTIFAAATSLMAACAVNNYLKNPQPVSLIQAVSWSVATAAAHHLTFVFFLPAASLPVIFTRIRMGVKNLLYRLLIFGLVSLLLTVTVLFPFIQFVTSQSEWREIPHGSRKNIFLDFTLSTVFFWGMYSFTIFLLPYAIAIAYRRRALLPILVLVVFNFLLGLGGTTPIPSLLLGPLWSILTYDRFAFWASVLYTPFLGVVVRERAGIFKKHRPDMGSPSTSRISKAVSLAMVCGLAASFISVSFITILLNLQPMKGVSDKQIESIASFLQRNKEWKYVTLGFDNKRILLNIMTDAPTIDGGYNQGKTSELLRSSGVESVDAAKHFPNGLTFLRRVIETEGNNGLKYIISADQFYNQILRDYGLIPVLTVPGEKEVIVWEIPGTANVPAYIKPEQGPSVTLSWGLGPILLLQAALATTILRLTKRGHEHPN